MRTPQGRPIGWLLPLLIGAVGVLAALTLPFAPVWAEQTTVTWPNPGTPAVSSTAFFVPYRPTGLTASVSCHAMRAASAASTPTVVLATAPGGDGLLVTASAGQAKVLLNGRLVTTTAVGPDHCHIRVDAGPTGTTVATPDGVLTWRHEPIPQVTQFHTDLTPEQADGLAVTARTASVFEVRSTGQKRVVLAVWAGAALLGAGWLALRRRAALTPSGVPGAWRDPVRWAIDASVGLALAGWAVIGPLSDDDGFAAMIARNSAAAGYQGNYYRWWNASETPFALAQHLLAPLTQVSLAPLWLRLPSTVLAVASWLVLHRALLPVAVPTAVQRRWPALLASVCFLACWLPFNLGVRPEAYVAFGLISVLALLWRGRGIAALATATTVAAVTATASPAAVLLGAPVLVFAPRIWRMLRAGARHRGELAARIAVLCCLACAAPALVFADQSWNALRVATDWHTAFGPSMAWYQEVLRYQYLLAADQDGTATKRVPVLLTLGLLPVVGLLLARRVRPGPGAVALARLSGVVVLGLLLLALTPSKWTHYFGALAGMLGLFLVASVVYLVGAAGEVRGGSDRVPPSVGLAGSGLVALAAALAFSGPNAWWQPVVYQVPWADGPIRPAGMPLSDPLLWLALGAVSWSWVRLALGGPSARAALVTGPGLLAATALAVSVAVLLTSFVAAPMREPSGSLALGNLRRLTGTPSCGLGDDVQVLPDVPDSVMTPTGPDPGRADGFRFGAGYDLSAPPPDPPGTGTSTQLWGSDTDTGPPNTATLNTPWFALPAVRPDQEVTVSVAGRTDNNNSLSVEFGTATSNGAVSSLAALNPADPVHNAPSQPPDYRLWRAVGIPAVHVPPGANRVRIHAVDASSDPDGWLAVTGPRLRHVVSLSQFLAGHGPVLVAWPLAFLFPCATDPVTVRDGMAQAPATVLEAPLRYAGLSSVSTDASAGGDFAGLRGLGGLSAVSTRVVNRPDLDWGQLFVARYPAARDGYRTHVARKWISGADGVAITPAPPGSNGS